MLFLRANNLNSSYPVRLTGLGIDTFDILSLTPLAGRTIPRTFCFGTSTSDARPICPFSFGVLWSVFSYLFNLLFGCRRIARTYQTQPCTIPTLSRPFVAFHLDNSIKPHDNPVEPEILTLRARHVRHPILYLANPDLLL